MSVFAKEVSTYEACLRGGMSAHKACSPQRRRVSRDAEGQFTSKTVLTCDKIVRKYHNGIILLF